MPGLQRLRHKGLVPLGFWGISLFLFLYLISPAWWHLHQSSQMAYIPGAHKSWERERLEVSFPGPTSWPSSVSSQGREWLDKSQQSLLMNWKWVWEKGRQRLGWAWSPGRMELPLSGGRVVECHWVVSFTADTIFGNDNLPHLASRILHSPGLSPVSAAALPHPVSLFPLFHSSNFRFPRTLSFDFFYFLFSSLYWWSQRVSWLSISPIFFLLLLFMKIKKKIFFF